MNFWKNLEKPIFVMAPMADVTDVAFRQMFAKYGKPDVMWTEFVSADGLVLAPEENKKQLLIDLKYFENERPIVAQIFSGNPKYMKKAAQMVAEMGFDGIDINMGCPVRTINKQMAGAELIKDPKLAKRIIKATMKGVKKSGKNIPVSVKTRLGFHHDTMEDWLKTLLKTKPALITIHARTRKEMSKVPAKWDRVADAVKMRDKMGSETLIFGNGDVRDMNEARERVRETGCDGVMVGRGIFGNPNFFNEKQISKEEKLELLLEHAKLFDKYLGEYKNFNIMKKHFKAYVNGFDGAKDLRDKLMKEKDLKGVEKVIEEYKI